MKKLFTSVLFVIISIITSNAHHMLGGQIDYRYLGNGKFEITVAAYRDCNTSGLSNPPATYMCTSGTGHGQINLTKISSRDVTDITPGCGISSKCASGSFDYGIEEQVFQGIADFSAFNCCEVIVGWEQCCVGSLTTMSTTNNFYIEARINKCAPSSFSWSKAKPQYLIALGQDQVLNFSGSDVIDNDSISYSLENPLSSNSNQMGYAGQWSAAKPITFLGFPNAGLNAPAGIQFDTAQGNIKFRPRKKDETTMIAVKATEWRKINGVMTVVGTCLKQMVVVVYSSTTNKIPYQNSSAVFAACGTDTSIAVIDFVDGDVNDTFSLLLRHNLKWASASFVGSNQSRTVVVKYLVDSIPNGLIQNAFTLEIADNGCPVRGRSIKTYGIRDKGVKFIDNSTITKSITCNKVKFKANNTLSGIKYSWAITQNALPLGSKTDSIEVGVLDTGWVKAKLVINSVAYCNFYEKEDSIYVGTANLLKVYAGKDTSVCNSPQMSFTATPSFGTQPYTYLWWGGKTTQTITETPMVPVQQYYVTVTDATGCKISDDVKVTNYHPKISITTGPSIVCKNTYVGLTANFTDGINPKYGWFGITNNVNTIFETITATTQYTFTVLDGGCVFSAVKTINVSDPQLQYTHDTASCIGDTLLLRAIPSMGVTPYSVYWDTYRLQGESVGVSTNNAAVGYTYFTTSVSDGLGCKSTTNGRVFLNPKPVVTVTPLNPVCATQSPINLASLATPANGTWAGTGISGAIFSPSLAGKGIHLFNYGYKDPITGCSNFANSFIRVVAAPVIGFTADSTIITKGSKIQFTNTTIADTATTANWLITGPNTNVSPSGNNPSFTFNDIGLFTVKLLVSGPVCAPDSITKTNYIRVNAPLNISVNELVKTALKIYPNPASGEVFIEADFEIARVLVTDILGREIQPTYTINGITTSVGLTSIAEGTYLLTVEGADGKKSITKLIITR